MTHRHPEHVRLLTHFNESAPPSQQSPRELHSRAFGHGLLIPNGFIADFTHSQENDAVLNAQKASIRSFHVRSHRDCGNNFKAQEHLDTPKNLQSLTLTSGSP